jgi:hypothetical protein
MAAVWRFVPQKILSLLIFRLAFTGQKQVYHKATFAEPGSMLPLQTHEGATTQIN